MAISGTVWHCSLQSQHRRNLGARRAPGTVEQPSSQRACIITAMSAIRSPTQRTVKPQGQLLIRPNATMCTTWTRMRDQKSGTPFWTEATMMTDVYAGPEVLGDVRRV